MKTVEAVVQTDEFPDVVPKDSKPSPDESKVTAADVKAQFAPLFWCLDCDAAASLECVDEHPVRSLRAVRVAR